MSGLESPHACPVRRARLAPTRGAAVIPGRWGGPATGKARLKTGTLRDAVGLAGFVPDASGKPWVFVALLNHPEAAAKGRPVLDALVAWVARQP